METIKINNGSNSFNAPITDSCERSHSLQQHNYVKLVWKSAENKPISANAYIEYEGQVFYCLDDYFPTHKDGIYEYDIEFHAIEDTFNRPLFFRYVDILDQTTGKTTSWKEIEWSLNGNLKTIADIVITCLNKAYDNAYFELPKDSYTDTLLMSYSFSGNSIADALSTIAEQNETEWWLEITAEYVEGKRKYILHFDKCEIGDTIELNDNYTEDANGVWQSGGLKSVSQSGNTNIIPQKLYVYGSERNIIKKTVEQQIEGGKMNVSYDKKLRLPKIFPNTIIGANNAIYENNSLDLIITLNEDSSLSIDGINNHFEQVKIFDEVYPKMDMEVTAVSIQNPSSENPIYWIKGDRLKSITTENPVDGSINPGKLGLLIEGCTLMCTFTSGLLNGREFECAWRESSAEIGLIPIDENDIQIPSGVFKPQEGDTFILWNLAMPQSSIEIAQEELCIEAINYIEELATSITDTDCVSEPEAFRKGGYNQQIKVGQRITVASNVFRNGRLASRIIKFSYKLTKPYDISFTLASSRQTGRLATLENMIADVTQEVHTTGQVQRAISRRQWHDTEEMMSMLDSIQKQMVVVGDENNAFTTSCNVDYNNDTKILFVSRGYLQHQSYTDNEWKGAWLIKGKDGNDDASINISAIDENGTTPFYVYFVCSKNESVGYVEVGLGLPQYNDYYVFGLGILSAEFEGNRVFNQSSGLTTMAGGTITTEVIQDPARQLIIDFTNRRIIARNGAEIIGNIKFLSANGNELDLSKAFDQSTTIDGGLVLTNFIQLLDQLNEVTAGITGVDSIFAWAGGDFEQAKNGNVPVLIKRNGIGSKFGCFQVEDGDKIRVKTENGSVLIDADGGITMYDDNNNEKIIIVPNDLSIVDINKFFSIEIIPNDFNISYDMQNNGYYYHNLASFRISSTSNILKFNTDDNEWNIFVKFSANASMNQSQFAGVFSPEIDFQLYNQTTQEIKSISLSKGSLWGTFTESGSVSSETKLSYHKLEQFINLQPGVYVFRIMFICPEIIPTGATALPGNSYIKNATMNFQSSSKIKVEYSKNNNVTLIGKNGMIVNNNYWAYLYASINGELLDFRARGLPTSATEKGQLYTDDGIIKIKQ